MANEPFQFTVTAPQVRDAHSFVLTVRIEVPDGDQRRCKDVLHYIRNVQLKNDLMNGWIRENASGYGMEIRGGPRPVLSDPSDRASKVVAYEQDFKLVRPL